MRSYPFLIFGTILIYAGCERQESPQGVSILKASPSTVAVETADQVPSCEDRSNRVIAYFVQSEQRFYYCIEDKVVVTTLEEAISGVGNPSAVVSPPVDVSEQSRSGEQGIQGEHGDSGAQGIQGERGDSGAQGIQGERGYQVLTTIGPDEALLCGSARSFGSTVHKSGTDNGEGGGTPEDGILQDGEIDVQVAYCLTFGWVELTPPVGSSSFNNLVHAGQHLLAFAENPTKFWQVGNSSAEAILGVDANNNAISLFLNYNNNDLYSNYAGVQSHAYFPGAQVTVNQDLQTQVWVYDVDASVGHPLQHNGFPFRLPTRTWVTSTTLMLDRDVLIAGDESIYFFAKHSTGTDIKLWRVQGLSVQDLGSYSGKLLTPTPSGVFFAGPDGLYKVAGNSVTMVYQASGIDRISFQEFSNTLYFGSGNSTYMYRGNPPMVSAISSVLLANRTYGRPGDGRQPITTGNRLGIHDPDGNPAVAVLSGDLILSHVFFRTSLGIFGVNGQSELFFARAGASTNFQRIADLSTIGYTTFSEYRGLAYFGTRSSSELYQTDGTASGTRVVPGYPGSSSGNTVMETLVKGNSLYVLGAKRLHVHRPVQVEVITRRE